MFVTATRYHDFCAGHRVYGHENKCAHVHGHNYRVHFTCTARKLDSVGRVVDFSFMKTAYCDWLETHWDHKLLLWDQDPLVPILLAPNLIEHFKVAVVSFNPTAENMADWLFHNLAYSYCWENENILLSKVVVEETRKCSAACELEEVYINAWKK